MADAVDANGLSPFSPVSTITVVIAFSDKCMPIIYNISEKSIYSIFVCLKIYFLGREYAK